jgi:mannosyl-oligosaccharide glucosidase
LGDFEIQIIDSNVYYTLSTRAITNPSIIGPLNIYPDEGFNQNLGLTQWWGREVPQGNIWRSKGIDM